MIQLAAAFASTPSAIVRLEQVGPGAVGDEHARDVGLQTELGRVPLTAGAREARAPSRGSRSTHASDGSSGGMSGSGKYR